MVNELAHGPAAGPVGCFELFFRKRAYRRTKVVGKSPNAFDGRASLFGREGFRVFRATNRIAEKNVFRCHAGHLRPIVSLRVLSRSSPCGPAPSDLPACTRRPPCDRTHPVLDWSG